MRNRRAIALVTVLVTAGILLMMLGAFVTLNRDYFGLIKTDQHHMVAEEAARSVLDYCVYRLEHDRYWGKGDFETHRTDDEVGSILEVREVKDSRRFVGRVVACGTEFEGTILNNIEGDNAVDGVQKGDCRIRITARRGGTTLRREAFLTTAPIFDASGVASGGFLVDANLLTVASTDPRRNRIRSKGDIQVPSYNGSFVFDPPDDASEQGVLWAAQGIAMGSRDLSDPANLEDAVATTGGGQFYPQAQTHYDIHDLHFSEVKVPTNEVTMDPGMYVFTRAAVPYTSPQGSGTAEIPMLRRTEFAVVDGLYQNGDVKEFWYYTGSLPAGATINWGNLWGDGAVPHPVDSNDFHVTTGVAAHFNGVLPHMDGAGPPDIVFNTDVTLRVNGNFGVTAHNVAYSPVVIFRDPESGVIEQGAIVAEQGSIYIEGRFNGSGKLIATGDVTLRPNKADMESDTDSELSIFAGNDIFIRPPHTNQALHKSTFRGLLYARNDVTIQGWDLGLDIDVEGAVVAREGRIAITSADKVTLRYNREYLDSILKVTSATRVRLERVVWRER